MEKFQLLYLSLFRQQNQNQTLNPWHSQWQHNDIQRKDHGNQTEPTQSIYRQTKWPKFLQDVTLYISIDKEIYDKDKKKIGFMLSFITEGDAASWKEEFLARKMDEADWARKDMVKKSFEPFDGPGNALEEMKTLRMASNGNIDKHLAKFRMLVTKSGLMALAAIMDLFQETLPTPLQK